MANRLAPYPIVSTRNTDEAQSVLSRELTDLCFKSVRDRRLFGLEMNGVHLGRTMIGYNQFETDTLVDLGEVDGEIILIVGDDDSPSISNIDSPSISNIDGESIVCANRGAIISPSRRVVNHRPAGGGVFVVRAGFNAIEERFREIMDWRPRKTLVFERSVDLANGVGAQARSLVNFLVDTLQRDSVAVENPLLRAGFDDMLLNVLVSLPNNYTDELTSGRRICVAPRLVRRAEEFLEAHATEPITISDVLAQCGCSKNALFSAFRRFRGYTPMQFLADARFKAAREALLGASQSDTVSSIAYACGFSHLGRFSDAYRRRFGESPSETMRKARTAIGM